jgi:tripartite-type tricarboxylate transporter receptor subunit TctC
MWRHLLRGALALIVTGSAFAQPFPSKPIRIVVPYSAGGTADAMARILQVPMAKALGQPVIVDNKTGAAGAIGTREVALSKPDGYTLVLGVNAPHSILPAMSEKLGYEGLADFTPISLIGTTPLVLIVSPSLPVKDLRSFVEYGRASTVALPFSTSGIGAMSHLTAELFGQRTGIKVLAVPYRGQAPTVTSVVAGEVKFAFTSPSSAINSLVESGQLKLLGVTTRDPSPLMPGVPPIGTVLPGFEAQLWYGFLAAAKTPTDIVERLHAAIVAALADPNVRRGFTLMGAEPQSSTSEQLADIIRTETPQWAALIHEKGIRAQ